MRKSRIAEAQIVGILREYDAAVPTAELARKHGIHAGTLRRWKAKYGEMTQPNLLDLSKPKTRTFECDGSSPIRLLR